jgi:uncharacterized protein
VQKTNYPWEGAVKLTVSPSEPADFTVNVRIPGWAKGAKVAVSGKAVDGAKPGEYLTINRRWAPGDTITLEFPMAAEIVASNPRVEENLGRVAVQRGPIVYCMEGLDQSPAAKDFSEVAIVVNPKSLKAFEVEHQPALLEGVTVLKHSGAVYESALDKGPLYAEATGSAPKTRSESLTLIPYYAWANRKPTEMQVWIPLTRT